MHQVRPQINTGAYSFFAWEIDLQYHVWVHCFNIVNAVDERLVHVKDQNFLVFWVPRFGQVYKLVLDSIFSHYSQVILNELQSGKCVLEMLSV